jgi:CRP-like cAMP-binding protein
MDAGMATAGDGRKPSILVAEDNWLVADAVCDLVRSFGFSVAGSVAGVQSGLRAVQNEHVDGAIVDVRLGNDLSFPLCDALARRRIPFVFMSNYQRALLPPVYRAHTLLTKPIQPQLLRAALSNFVTVESPCRFGNAVLDALPPDRQEAMEGLLEQCVLEPGRVVGRPGQPVGFLYFPVSSALSLLTAARGFRQMEMALIGSKGMTGVELVLGRSQASFEISVYSPGTAWRLPARDAQALIERDGEVRRHFLGRVHSLLEQTSETVAANAQLTVESLVARRLLIVADRLDSDEILVTHGALADALAVRRSGVTMALHLLESKGLVRSRRCVVRLLDRAGLMEQAAKGKKGPPAGEPFSNSAGGRVG